MKFLLHFTFILLTLSGIVGCGSDKSGPPTPPEAPERGWICVSALNQMDEPASPCYYDFRVANEVRNEDEGYTEACMDYLEEVGGDAEGCEAFTGSAPAFPPELACGENEQAVYGAPGKVRVYAECGSLAGRLEFYLEPGENEPYASRLVGSLCSDGQPLVATRDNNVIYLDELIGFSDAHRCGNWIFDNPDAEQAVEVAEIRLDCTGIQDCQPEDGRNYLKVSGEKWEYSDTHPKHLTLLAETPGLGYNEEVQLLVRIRERIFYDQEIEIPVTVRNE